MQISDAPLSMASSIAARCPPLGGHRLGEVAVHHDDALGGQRWPRRSRPRHPRRSRHGRRRSRCAPGRPAARTAATGRAIRGGSRCPPGCAGTPWNSAHHVRSPTARRWSAKSCGGAADRRHHRLTGGPAQRVGHHARLGDRRNVHVAPAVGFLGEQRADQVLGVPAGADDDHARRRGERGSSSVARNSWTTLRRSAGESASCMFLCASSTTSRPVAPNPVMPAQDAGGEQSAAVPVEFPPADRGFLGRQAQAEQVAVLGDDRPRRCAVRLREGVGVGGEDVAAVGVAAQCFDDSRGRRPSSLLDSRGGMQMMTRSSGVRIARSISADTSATAGVTR